jgi:hypothetical protein
MTTVENALRDSIGSSKYCTNFDIAALKCDHKIYPKKPANHRSEPRWEGLNAKQYLKHDVDRGKHEIMKLKALYNTQIEYQDYPLVVFQKHIHQEVKQHKFIAYCQDKAERRRVRVRNRQHVH